jgi:ketol-acid reductoisomerase
VSGPRVVDDGTREEMRRILAEIQDGSFAKRFVDDYESGGELLRAKRAEGRSHPIEQVGRDLRAMMPWIQGPSEELE